MTSKERLELIRAKAVKLAKPKPELPRLRGPHYVRYGKGGGFCYNFMGELRPDRLPRDTGWVRVADEVKPRPLAPKRTAKVHPLTKIALQPPAKLPVLTFDPKTLRRL